MQAANWQNPAIRTTKSARDFTAYLYENLLTWVQLTRIGDKAQCENKHLPTSITNFPWDLHSFRRPFIQLFKSTRQFILNGRSFPGSWTHRPSIPKGTKHVFTKHAPKTWTTAAAPHPTKWAREAEKFSKDVIGIPGVESELHIWSIPSLEKCWPASIWGHLPFKPFFTILVIYCSFLGITENLKTQHPQFVDSTLYNLAIKMKAFCNFNIGTHQLAPTWTKHIQTTLNS